MKNSDMPAMPLSGDAYTDINGNAMTEGSIEPGMGLTKREAFTMAAMQGLLSNPSIIDSFVPEVKAWIADHSAKMADAQLKALDNEQI